MFITPHDDNYELLDSGNGMKLERFGKYTLSRPEPEAIWNIQNGALWDEADLFYDKKSGKGEWGRAHNEVSNSWHMQYGGLNFLIKPTAFKHVGLFPEQLSNWNYFKEHTKGQKNLKVLNLFGYTGGASMMALSLGHDVTHVDSSQGVNDWLKENCKLSDLDATKLHIITDDVNAYINRLIKRGDKFDWIILDPPAFGHGNKKEIWRIEDDLPELIDAIGAIMSDDSKSRGIILSGYSAGYSAESYENILKPFMETFGGKVESGNMSIQESNSDRLLTVGIVARWSK